MIITYKNFIEWKKHKDNNSKSYYEEWSTRADAWPGGERLVPERPVTSSVTVVEWLFLGIYTRGGSVSTAFCHSNANLAIIFLWKYGKKKIVRKT